VLVPATRPVALPDMVPLVPLTRASGIAAALLVAVRGTYVRPPMFCMTSRSSCGVAPFVAAQG
jgi:hypothetical protein